MINFVLPFDVLNFLTCKVTIVVMVYVLYHSAMLICCLSTCSRGAVMSGPVSAEAILALQAVTSVKLKS